MVESDGRLPLPTGEGRGEVLTSLASKKLVAGTFATALALGGALGGYVGYTSGYSAAKRDLTRASNTFVEPPVPSASIEQKSQEILTAQPETHAPSSTSRLSPPTSTTAEAPTPNDLRRERELIDAARSALVKGNAKEAIGLLGTHAKRYPKGQLSQEREALRKHAAKELERVNPSEEGTKK